MRVEIEIEADNDFFSIERVIEPDHFALLKLIAGAFNRNAEHESSIRIIVREK